MDPDVSLVVGLVLAVLAVPAIVSAFSDKRAPRVAALVVLIAGSLVFYAINTKEGDYRIRDVPKIVYSVIGRVI